LENDTWVVKGPSRVSKVALRPWVDHFVMKDMDWSIRKHTLATQKVHVEDNTAVLSSET